ncbi:MAG TPA: hypothetical protein PLZ67_05365 [Bacteroidales bacterium]|nr:hypothetical protein [Bacteroidales bacterium]
MKSTFVFFLILMTYFLAAQKNTSPEIRIESWNALESKTLSSDFFSSFYFGEYIDSSSKWNEIEHLKEKNHIGFFSNHRIEVMLPSEKKHSLYFSGSHQSLLGAGFSKDLFQLVFTGNNSLIGQHVITNPATMNQYSFSTLSAGIAWQINDDIKIHAAAGPVALYSCARLDFSESDFFTSLAADSLALNLEGNYMRSGGHTFIKGGGFSTEFGIEGTNGDFEWRVTLSNIGRVWMNKRTIDSQRDTLMYFTGVEVSDLSDFSAFVEDELDNLEEGFSLKGDTMNTAIALPLLITGECRTEFGKFRTDLSILYYNLPGFFPYVQLRPSWPLTEGIRISLPMKYGGYGSFNAGPGLEFKIFEKLSAQLDFPAALSVLNINRNLSYVVVGRITYKITEHASLL